MRPASTRPAFRGLIIIPAHNEAANLPAVIADLRRHRPDLDILVVDDGSVDGTEAVLEQLKVRWLRWVERRGVGAAIRAGLRYALRSGFTAAVRVDADGQHDARDIDRLLAPIAGGTAEVVLGTRYGMASDARSGATGAAQRMLAAFITLVTRNSVTDPTWDGATGLYFHSDGYPEPELHLFLSRNAIALTEVPVQSRVRLSGKTSLTPLRVVAASARVLLALLIVPVRPAVESLHD